MDISEKIRLAISSVVTFLTMPCVGEVTFERVRDLLVAELKPPTGSIPAAMVRAAISEIKKIEAERAVPEYLPKGRTTRREIASKVAVPSGSTRPYTDRRQVRVWTPAVAHTLYQRRQCG